MTEKSLDPDEYLKLLEELIAHVENERLELKNVEQLNEKVKESHNSLRASFFKWFSKNILDYIPQNYDNEVCRGIKTQYGSCPLSWAGSLYSDGRFHSKGQPTLYLTEKPEAILAELPSTDFFKYQHTTLPVDVKLAKIFNLENLEKDFGGKIIIDVCSREWRFEIDIIQSSPISHTLANVLRDNGFEGIRYRSVRIEQPIYNLAIFPKNLSNNSSITLKNPQHGQHPTVMNSLNLKDFDPEINDC